MTEEDLRAQLEIARATIASQSMRLHQLEATQGAGGVDALREILQLSAIAGELVGRAPYRALLQGIIQAAQRLFAARAASVALHDHETNELVFEAAIDTEIIGLRFPAHRGIAGWVMMSGEPIAVSDVQRDPRFARDFAETTGYMPTSILAVPLMVGEDVEGVLEILDKTNNASFGLDDMEAATLFARPAAVAVEQARTIGTVGTALVGELRRLAAEEGKEELAEVAQSALVGGSSVSEGTIELARLVQRLARHGDRGTRLAIEVLESILKHLYTAE